MFNALLRRKEVVKMKELVNFKKEMNDLMKKYGYEIMSYCLDERIGRSTHRRATLEFVLEPIKEEPEE